MNNIIVISGPSGSGKSTLIHILLKKNKELNFSVSYTSRKKRVNEENGKNYYFISKGKFREMIDTDKFVEWAKVHSNYYGTSWDEIDLKSKNDKIVVLDLDVQGAKNIKKKFSDALFILIAPPSLKELEKRLINREHNKINKDIKQRLQIVKNELEQYKLFDYIVINENLKDASSVLNCIYTSFLNLTCRKRISVERIIGEK